MRVLDTLVVTPKAPIVSGGWQPSETHGRIHLAHDLGRHVEPLLERASGNTALRTGSARHTPHVCPRGTTSIVHPNRQCSWTVTNPSSAASNTAGARTAVIVPKSPASEAEIHLRVPTRAPQPAMFRGCRGNGQSGVYFCEQGNVTGGRGTVGAGDGDRGGVNIVRDGVIAEHVAVQSAGIHLAQGQRHFALPSASARMRHGRLHASLYSLSCSYPAFLSSAVLPSHFSTSTHSSGVRALSPAPREAATPVHSVHCQLPYFFSIALKRRITRSELQCITLVSAPWRAAQPPSPPTRPHRLPLRCAAEAWVQAQAARLDPWQS